ncbi:MAG: hypothetical protein ACKVIN_03875, partial [Longimicrobiales bacterium]
VELTLALVSEDGDLVPLTDSEVRVRVDLGGVRESEIADQVVPAARYIGLRLVFIEIEVEVDAGLIINGTPVTGAIDVARDCEKISAAPVRAVTAPRASLHPEAKIRSHAPTSHVTTIRSLTEPKQDRTFSRLRPFARSVQ